MVHPILMQIVLHNAYYYYYSIQTYNHIKDVN